MAQLKRVVFLVILAIFGLGGCSAALAPLGGFATPGAVEPAQSPGSTVVFPARECIGAVVNGVCHGGRISTDPMPVRCHGEMLNGRCTGPMF